MTTRHPTPPRHTEGPEAYEPAAEGKRTDKATSNIEQARQAGLDSPSQGSRQGKDADLGDPGRARRG